MNNRKVQYIKTEITEIQRDSLITEYSIFQSFPVILCISKTHPSWCDTKLCDWRHIIENDDPKQKVYTFRCQSG